LDTQIYMESNIPAHILLRKPLKRAWLMDSGYAKHMALPLLRAFYSTKGDRAENISKEEALGVIRKCMEVLYYRDARSLNKFTIGIVSRTEGIEILKDQTSHTDWSVGEKVRGYGAQVV
jgi:20S proteasome subunit beta 7